MNSSQFGEQSGSITELTNNLKIAILKFWRQALPITLAFLLLTVTLLIVVPNYYTSGALIFIQPQRITSKIVDAPEKDEMRERLEALVQEILSRPRLRSIIETHGLYPYFSGIQGKEKAIKKFRNAIEIKPVDSPIGEQLQQTFELKFTHQNPVVALEVMKSLSNLFIEESILARRSEVQGTEDFLEGQLTDVRKKMEETESQIQKFMSENFGQLPENLDASVARLQSIQSQLATNSELITANSERRRHLQDELNSLLKAGSAVISAEQGGTLSGDPYENISQLEAALVVLQSKYSDRHPDVVSTRTRIDQLKQQVKSIEKGGKGGEKGGQQTASVLTGSPAVLRVRREMKELDIQIKALKEENERMKEASAKLQKDIEVMPSRQQEILRVRRDYENLRENYQRLLAAREDASLESSLLRSQKGARFRLVEPPELPIIPTGPYRSLIALGGVLLTLMMFFGVVLSRFFFDDSYKSRTELERDFGLPVLGIVPAMATREVVVGRKNAITVGYAVAGSTYLVLTAVIVYILFRT